jgi:hypothetical protein
MSAPPQAIAPNPHTNLLNVYIYIYRLQIKWGLKKHLTSRAHEETKDLCKRVNKIKTIHRPWRPIGL